MFWFYVTGFATLVGGEVNAVIEAAAPRAGNAEANQHGEKAAEV